MLMRLCQLIGSERSGLHVEHKKYIFEDENIADQNDRLRLIFDANFKNKY